MQESYVQSMVQDLQNWTSSHIYKAFAVLVSILHENAKALKPHNLEQFQLYI